MTYHNPDPITFAEYEHLFHRLYEPMIHNSFYAPRQMLLSTGQVEIREAELILVEGVTRYNYKREHVNLTLSGDSTRSLSRIGTLLVNAVGGCDQYDCLAVPGWFREVLKHLLRSEIPTLYGLPLMVASGDHIYLANQNDPPSDIRERERYELPLEGDPYDL